MRKASASLLCLTMLSGCGGTLPWRPLPPALPTTAATECRPVEQLCKLPEDFAVCTDAKCLDRQAALIQACHAVNTIEYSKCELRHRMLIEWAKEQAK